MRLGVMGGTFDPIHIGHLFVAEEARSVYNLDRVLFITNGNPPHKRAYELTPKDHRFEMTRLAVQSNPFFDSDDTEMHRIGPSYAIDSLKSLQHKYPDAELYYIIGIDAAAEILTWRNPDEVMKLATFVAATRPGYDQDLIAEKLPASYLQKITRLDIEPVCLDISSTEIRRRMACGLPVKYLVPDDVLEYIHRHKLYSLEDRMETATSLASGVRQ